MLRRIHALKFGGLVVVAGLAASIIAAMNFTTMYTVAQNATSASVSNITGGYKTSSSSCSSSSTASSCYDAGYQDALANPGKTCPSGYSYNYCAGWAHAREKR
jgi:hypothetical protein